MIAWRRNWPCDHAGLSRAHDFPGPVRSVYQNQPIFRATSAAFARSLSAYVCVTSACECPSNTCAASSPYFDLTSVPTVCRSDWDETDSLCSRLATRLSASVRCLPGCWKWSDEETLAHNRVRSPAARPRESSGKGRHHLPSRFAAR